MTLNQAPAPTVPPVLPQVAAAVAATTAAPNPAPVMTPAAQAPATQPVAAAIPVPVIPGPSHVQPMADVQVSTKPFQIPATWAHTAGPSRSPPHNPQRSRSPVRRGQCLPAPMRMGSSYFKLAQSRPSMLVTSFNELRRWVVANDHSFPEDMMSFIHDHEVKDFLSSYMIANPAFILDEFIAALQNYVSGEVRNPVEIARSLILNRSIVQENDSPAKYAQRFQQSSRLLPDESQSSLCQHYLAGLHPSLRQRCALDRDGNTWHSLQALIKCSYAKDIRLSHFTDRCVTQNRVKQGFTPNLERRERTRSRESGSMEIRNPNPT